MTESEAKTKWCPFVQVSINGDGSRLANNRFRVVVKDETADNKCFGSHCMAWRATDNEVKENPEGPIEQGRAMMSSDYVSAGYCGLAGKP